MAIVDSLLETSIIAHSPHPILVEAKVVLVAIAAHDQEVLEAVALHICACEGLRNEIEHKRVLTKELLLCCLRPA